MKSTNLIAAIADAIAAEEKAREFYERAAAGTGDEGGAAMFRELAQFECHHRDQLTALRTSLEVGGDWTTYEGRELPKICKTEGCAVRDVQEDQTALDAVRIAIEAERQAEQQYRKLADQVPDSKGREMFLRLAVEEERHRKLLDDQYFALTNKGFWSWGD